MRPKKNPKKDLNRDRGVFFATVLVLLLALTYVGLEWKSFYENDYSDTYPMVEDELIEERHATQIVTKANSAVDSNLFDLETKENIIVITDYPENKEGVATRCFRVEDPPIFPGCEDEKDKRACFNKMIGQHISENLKIPETTINLGPEAKVYVMFEIQTDGSIDNIKMRGPAKVFEQEAARVIRLLPKMTPAKHQGNSAKFSYSIPITFQLQLHFQNTKNPAIK